MLRKIVAVIFIIVISILGFSATKPDTFKIQRTAMIKASPEKIFPYINDLHQWGAWSPWEGLDPALKKTFSGTPSGKGAIYEWDGNDKVGKGRMEIEETVPSSKILIKLDFFEPFNAHNKAEFSLQPQGKETLVSWTMYGPNPYISKVMSTFVSMDDMVGKDFETGLANLKSITER